MAWSCSSRLVKTQAPLLRFVVDMLVNKSYNSRYNILASQFCKYVARAFNLFVDLSCCTACQGFAVDCRCFVSFRTTKATELNGTELNCLSVHSAK